jgi:acid phosphatase (class A)
MTLALAESLAWRRSGCLFVLLLIGVSAHAFDAGLLDTAHFSATSILASPPPQNSATSQSELAELHRIQDHRSAEDFQRAKADSSEEDVFLFRDVMGESFTAANFPITRALFARLGATEEAVVGAAKEHWDRPRPAALDKTIVTCSDGHSGSYPSGHATRVYLYAVTLASMIPERHDAIFERAADYAHNRLVCGVHYASDVDAGRILGTAMAVLIERNPVFMRQLSAARKEARRILATTTRDAR